MLSNGAGHMAQPHTHFLKFSFERLLVVQQCFRVVDFCSWVYRYVGAEPIRNH